MSPRWNWDFEDEQRAPRKPATAPTLPAQRPVPRDPRARFRRRRLGAVAGFVIAARRADRRAVGLARRRLDLLGGHEDCGGQSGAHAAARGRAGARRKRRRLGARLHAVRQRRRRHRARTWRSRSTTARARTRPQILDVLEREHVPATFFVVGQEMRDFGASTEREIDDGFVIGDHTENHPMLAHALGARPERTALRTGRADRTARRAQAAPVPPAVRIVQRDDLAPAARR